MEVKNLKIKYIKGKACSKYYKELIFSYFDDPAKQDEKQLSEHIKSCNKCNRLLFSIKASTHITSSLNVKKNEYVNSINHENVKYNVNKIMDKISLENNMAKSNKKTYVGYGFINWLSGLGSFKNYKKALMPVGSIAAVIAVFFFVNMIFGSHNNLNFFPTKNNMESINNAAGEERENTDFIPKNSEQKDLDENDDQGYKDNSNLPVNDGLTGESGMIYVLQSYFNNGVKLDSIENFDLAINYYEIIEDREYTGIFSFKTGDINIINENIENMLAGNEISAEIEIITGVNREKLVEYIDRETMNEVFSDNFTGDVDYLVILIGR